jgi:hypothetical protein
LIDFEDQTWRTIFTTGRILAEKLEGSYWHHCLHSSVYARDRHAMARKGDAIMHVGVLSGNILHRSHHHATINLQ